VVPGALGVQEGGYLALGRLLGFDPETSLALSLSKRARELLLGMPGLVAWQLDASRREAGLPAARRFCPPAPFRAVNRGGLALRRTGVATLRLDADELVDEACRRTGLRDFDDESFRAPLRLLVDAYEEEANLTLIGRIAARHDTVRLLVSRLRVEADRKRHPDIAAGAVPRPPFIPGLPRTGPPRPPRPTTEDPATRAPPGPAAKYPSPPPERARYERDWRIARAGLRMRGLDLLAPTFKAIHPVGARLAQECLVITAHSFLSFQFQTTHAVPTYQRWLEAQDLRPAYGAH